MGKPVDPQPGGVLTVLSELTDGSGTRELELGNNELFTASDVATRTHLTMASKPPAPPVTEYLA